MTVRAVLVFLAVVSLLVAGTASAGLGDRQKRIVRADQARARAALLRPADLTGFTASPPSKSSGSYCAALDESDLTLTGDAASSTFISVASVVSSLSRVYATRTQSAASWRRSQRAAGQACTRGTLRKQAEAGGGELTSYGRISFPRLAEASVAYRAVVSGTGTQALFDVVFLKQGRGHAVVAFASAIAPFDQAARVRLARLVANRLTKAMRGA